MGMSRETFDRQSDRRARWRAVAAQAYRDAAAVQREQVRPQRHRRRSAAYTAAKRGCDLIGVERHGGRAREGAARTVAPVVSATLANARIFPTNEVVVPGSAESPMRQKGPQIPPPSLMTCTREAAAVV